MEPHLSLGEPDWGKLELWKVWNSKGAIHKGRRADPGGGGSAESGRSIFIRVWFYCFVRMQVGMGGLEILVLAGRPFWMALYKKLDPKCQKS